MMRKYSTICLIFLGLSFLLSGCAGPYTPVGAIWKLNPNISKSDKGKVFSRYPSINEKLMNRLPAGSVASDIDIRFLPARQVLHDQSPLSVYITDPEGIGNDYKLVIVYNGYDVTDSFLLQAEKKIIRENNLMVVTLDNVRFPPTQEHDIRVYYAHSRDQKLFLGQAKLHAPECEAFDQDAIVTTEKFRVKDSWLKLIENESKQVGFNAAMYTGLIAQESGFNSKAISWAKAIGLTQITPLAEITVAEKYPEWPRYPGLNKQNYFWINAAIKLGKITSQDEWRLDPRYSIKGGLTYLRYIKKYWEMPDHKKLLYEMKGSDPLIVSKVLLASYNSGPARVKRAINSRGKSWLEAFYLKEARKYVNKIMSYCYHFSREHV